MIITSNNQGVINADGQIVILRFVVPGLTVKGVSVALVRTFEDITTPEPDVVASDFIML